MSDLIEVEHEGIEGTARVPRSALKHMKGWKPVQADNNTPPAKKTAAVAAHNEES